MSNKPYIDCKKITEQYYRDNIKWDSYSPFVIGKVEILHFPKGTDASKKRPKTPRCVKKWIKQYMKWGRKLKKNPNDKRAYKKTLHADIQKEYQGRLQYRLLRNKGKKYFVDVSNGSIEKIKMYPEGFNFSTDFNPELFYAATTPNAKFKGKKLMNSQKKPVFMTIEEVSEKTLDSYDFNKLHVYSLENGFIREKRQKKDMSFHNATDAFHEDAWKEVYGIEIKKIIKEK